MVIVHDTVAYNPSILQLNVSYDFIIRVYLILMVYNKCAYYIRVRVSHFVVCLCIYSGIQVPLF